MHPNTILTILLLCFCFSPVVAQRRDDPMERLPQVQAEGWVEAVSAPLSAEPRSLQPAERLPTLNAWGILVLVILLLGSGIRYLKR